MSGSASGLDRARDGLDPRWGSKLPNTLFWKGSVGLAVGIILKSGLQFANVQWVGRGLIWGSLGGMALGLLELNDFFAAVELHQREGRSKLLDRAVEGPKRLVATGIAYVVTIAVSVAMIWGFTKAGAKAKQFVGVATGALAGYWITSTAVGYSLVAGRTPQRVRKLDQEHMPRHPFPIDIPNPTELIDQLRPEEIL